MSEFIFECPVCFENYDKDLCAPVSFQCGHSCCLSHTSIITRCPICRALTPNQRDCRPNYSLRDGAVLYFELLRSHDALLGTERVDVDVQNIAQVLSDEQFARRLQSELNAEDALSLLRTNPPAMLPPPPTMPPLLRQISRGNTRSAGNGNLKSCGHVCTLSIDKCCSCLDLRPMQELYPVYVDGIGWQEIGHRKDGYCPVCKRI